MKHTLGMVCAAALAVAAHGAAGAATVVYSGFAVADGQIGPWSFTQALVTIRFRGDTRNAYTTTENGVTVWRNDEGYGSVVITSGAKTVIANLSPRQIYVRYDPVNGSVGFGSFAIGSYYPLALGCEQSVTTCNPAAVVASTAAGTPGTQMVDAVADILATNQSSQPDSVYYSPAVARLETDLRGPTLVTGYASTCPTVTFNTSTAVCNAANPAVPLGTDHGNLFLFGKNNSADKGAFTAVVGEAEDD